MVAKLPLASDTRPHGRLEGRRRGIARPGPLARAEAVLHGALRRALFMPGTQRRLRLYPARLVPLPSHLQVEITSYCNLGCKMCSRTVGGVASPQHMDPELFHTILDELPTVTRLSLAGDGEPLMHPMWDALVAEAARRGVAVKLNTNGTLFTTKMIDQIVASDLQSISISFHGATAESVEPYIVGIRFADFVEGARRFVRGMAKSPIHVQARLVIRRSIRGELGALFASLDELGIRALSVQLLTAHDDAIAEELLTRRELAEVTSECIDLGRRYGIAVDPPRPNSPSVLEPEKRWVCGRWGWQSMYIRVDGSVAPCCHVVGRTGALGNVSREPVPEVWYGPAAQAFRRALRGSTVPAMCARCSKMRPCREDSASALERRFDNGAR